MKLPELGYTPVEWCGDRVRLLDQTRLPHEEIYLELTDYRQVNSAIRELRVRGAPAIGVAGAYAVALGALGVKAESKAGFAEELQQIIREVGSTRPTARNLFAALERMERVSGRPGCIPEVKDALVKEAQQIHEEEAAATVKLSEYGVTLIQDGMRILTHCNTGPLATTGYGTALGIIIMSRQQGKNISVYADETRPLLQGARLTVWELKKAHVPVTLIADSMAGYLMSRGMVGCVIVGADRIAANGDTANKIGTYSLAVLAKENGIPFYVAAPTSTVDTSIKSGEEIPIEQRHADEVTHIQGVCTAPDCEVWNPAFDVTPHRYITAIITERGVMREPYGEGMGKSS